MRSLSPKLKKPINETKIYGAVRWNHDHSGLAQMALSAVGLGIAGQFSTIWAQAIFYVISSGLFIRGSVLQTQGSATVSALQEEISNFQDGNDDTSGQLVVRVRTQLSNILVKYAREAKLDHHDRVTVYLLDPGNSIFTAVVRHSDNPVFSIIRRDSYAMDQGIISKAWLHGRSTYQHEEDASSDTYCENLKTEFNIPQKTARQIRMKSLKLVAIQLENAHSEPRAVIVAESILRDRDCLDTLIDRINSEMLLLVALLEVIQSLTSSPQEVAEEGF